MAMQSTRLEQGTGNGSVQLSNSGGLCATDKDSMQPSLDRIQRMCSEASPVLEPEEEARAMLMKQYRETLAGDLMRAVQQGDAINVDVWDPFIPWAPVNETSEVLMPEYEATFMRYRDDLPPCRLGPMCQGAMMAATLNFAGSEFILPMFASPRGTVFGELCIICLRLAFSRDTVEGKPWVPMVGMRPFKLSAFRYVGEGVIKD